ncbi:hypothetical protein PpBr36_02617 [Pyricularia pennisetigena]|uniref:hypothetical protein n=1 Tax=Pyricularia pennisetigena TaxID=1578925 RepID=UPI001152039B|nr:hypothetical protein PpBr36_02617 [Pyricularia pennisetigena]TLS30050.1 hypothetical protein PpBr36_02617 [Pyricularia pennisetigena]
MKLPHLLPVLVLTTLSLAQDANDVQIPACAVPCSLKALANSACGKQPQNLMRQCMCTDTDFMVQSTACVKANCTVKEGLVALRASKLTCGVTPRDERWYYRIIVLVFSPIACLLAGIRLLSKGVVMGWHQMGLDDLCISIVIITGIIPATLVTLYGTIPSGLGVDIWAVPVDNIYQFLKFHFIVTIIFFFQVGMLKLSILFFLIRIFLNRTVKYLLWATVAAVSLFTTITVLTMGLQCYPKPEAFWMSWDGSPEYQGQCKVQITALSLSNASFSVIVDIWMLAIPLWELRKLQLQTKKKLSVAVMFAIGILSTIISCYRINILSHGRSNHDNFTYTELPISLWSVVELMVGVICACMPALRLVSVKIFHKVSRTISKSASRSSKSQAPIPARDKMAACYRDPEEGLGVVPLPMQNLYPSMAAAYRLQGELSKPPLTAPKNVVTRDEVLLVRTKPRDGFEGAEGASRDLDDDQVSLVNLGGTKHAKMFGRPRTGSTSTGNVLPKRRE